MLSRIVLVSTVVLLSLGCGGPGSFDGKVVGNELNVDDAVFLALNDWAGNRAAAVLVMADFPDMCGKFKASREPKNATYVVFAVFRTQGSGTDPIFRSPDKGTYTVVDFQAVGGPTAPLGNFAFAYFKKNDANCRNVIDDERALAKSGKIDVEKIEFKNDGSMTGKFDVTFGPQNDKVKGSFDASFCDALLGDVLSCE